MTINITLTFIEIVFINTFQEGKVKKISGLGN
jgi:hypothetical protein